MKSAFTRTWDRSLLGPAILSVLALGFCSLSHAQAAATEAALEPKTTGAVKVVGNRLTRDEILWTPHGLNMIAFVQPPAAQPGGCDGKTSTVFQTAWNRYQKEGSQLFSDLVVWGADTVRLQVSQQGLDSKSNIYSAEFFKTFLVAVKRARFAGLNVVVSIQDECQSGDPTTANYPDDETEQVWDRLTPLFKNDLGIMFEIYNEPEPQPSPATWQTWQNRFNRIIARIRSTGAKNVVIADGLAFATTLEGAPDLQDSANEVVYAVHPYFHRPNLTPSFWDSHFGKFASDHPVLVTEWTTVGNSSQSGSNYYCDANTPSQAVALLQYLQDHDIGMLGFAWDFTGGIFGSVVYYPNNTASAFSNSTFSGAQCGNFGFGPGNTMQSWFQTGKVPESSQ